MKQPYFWQKIVRQIASSKGGASLFSKILPPLDRWVFKLTKGNHTAASIATGLSIVTLTTIGAKSGLSRSSPLLCIRDGKMPAYFAVIASNWGGQKNPAWYYNLKANPQATGSIQGQVQDYVAHEATGAEYKHFWQRAEETYLGFPQYKARAKERHIPIMVLRPVDLGEPSQDK